MNQIRWARPHQSLPRSSYPKLDVVVGSALPLELVSLSLIVTICYYNYIFSLGPLLQCNFDYRSYQPTSHSNIVIPPCRPIPKNHSQASTHVTMEAKSYLRLDQFRAPTNSRQFFIIIICWLDLPPFQENKCRPFKRSVFYDDLSVVVGTPEAHVNLPRAYILFIIIIIYTTANWNRDLWHDISCRSTTRPTMDKAPRCGGVEATCF